MSTIVEGADAATEERVTDVIRARSCAASTPRTSA